jgi:rare lipoprotein A
MPAHASSPQRRDLADASRAARGGKAALAFLFGLVFAAGMIWADNGEGYAAVTTAIPADTDVVIVSLADVGFPSTARAETPAAAIDGPKRVRAPGLRPTFAAAYRSVLRLVALANLPRIQEDAVLTQSAILGTASTYNPYRHGDDSGGFQTASGELYDPAAWTAAIQIDLRAKVGGVRYGRLYQPAYALVESGAKRAIVKINDVGPLKPGRVIDLNERSMRYFDPFLRRGLLTDVRITLLPGGDWAPGPIGGAELMSFASAE